MRSDYDKSLDILNELEAGDNRDGLFSCFGLTPHGRVIYFDAVGSPHRVSVKGATLVRGPLVNLEKMPIEAISQTEAFNQLAEEARQGYRQEWQTAQLRKLQPKTGQKRKSIAAAGLLILLAFGGLVWLNAGNFFQSLSKAEAQLKQFYADRGVSINGYKDVPMLAEPGTYNPLGPVSISSEVFRGFLNEQNSPALTEADALYQVCVLEGCDPAVALAFFEHESQSGKDGVAAYTKSIGNIRCTDNSTCFQTEGNGSFRRYASWSDGLRDWAKLLQFYKNDWKLITLEEIIPRYAPQADHNDETAYIAAVKGRVDNLRQREKNRSAVNAGELPVGSPVFEKDWVITQGFSTKHPEIDIARPLEVALGTSIHTTLGGVVTVVRDDPLFGNRVFISNGQFTAHYNHLLPDIPVKSGQVLQRGDVVGLMGSTGKSTGPHLDYELFQGQQRLDPSEWVYRH